MHFRICHLLGSRGVIPSREASPSDLLTAGGRVCRKASASVGDLQRLNGCRHRCRPEAIDLARCDYGFAPRTPVSGLPRSFAAAAHSEFPSTLAPAVYIAHLQSLVLIPVIQPAGGTVLEAARWQGHAEQFRLLSKV